MSMAHLVAGWSKDPSTKVGCVIVSTKKHQAGRILATGFNGFVENAQDDEELYLDREFKYKHITHAEDNALQSLLFPHNRLVLFSSFPVCPECVDKIIATRQRGIYIDKIIQPKFAPLTIGRSNEWIDGWKTSICKSEIKLTKAGIEIEEIEYYNV